jgi:HlyD family secretion protein
MDEVGAANASRQYNRAAQLMGASGGRNISRQDYENAKAAMDSANAKVNASKAQLAILQQQLNDADLYAPTNATVRTRVLEPGEMASPQRPVLALAMTDPKWVRVYVVESDLGKLRPGMAATVSVDGFPNRPFQGWVGFISSMAEFTPKNIETAELRTSLVYEVRVFVKDPLDVMRLGMPATVHLPLSPLPKVTAQ